MKKLLISAAIATAALASGCSQREADVASDNISEAADQFKILRRVIFINGITNDHLLEIQGFCSLGNYDREKLTVTCKTDDGQFKKHFLGLSHNMTFFAEQIDPAAVSGSHYHVTFRPQTLLPSVTLSTK